MLLLLLLEHTKPFPSSRSSHLSPPDEEGFLTVPCLAGLFSSFSVSLKCHVYNFDRYCQIAFQKRALPPCTNDSIWEFLLTHILTNSVIYQSLKLTNLMNENLSHLARWALAPVIVRETGGIACVAFFPFQHFLDMDLPVPHGNEGDQEHNAKNIGSSSHSVSFLQRTCVFIARFLQVSPRDKFQRQPLRHGA